MSSVKEEAKRLVEELPDQVTWDDIMYEFYVKKKIEVGLRAADEGRVVSHEEAKKRLQAS
jgi:predicted transcriptional regulator